MPKATLPSMKLEKQPEFPNPQPRSVCTVLCGMRKSEPRTILSFCPWCVPVLDQNLEQDNTRLMVWSLRWASKAEKRQQRGRACTVETQGGHAANPLPSAPQSTSQLRGVCEIGERHVDGIDKRRLLVYPQRLHEHTTPRTSAPHQGACSRP